MMKKKLSRELFDKLIRQGIYLKEKLKEKNLYHYLVKKVHLENHYNPFNYHREGDRKIGGKIQSKTTKIQSKTTKIQSKTTKIQNKTSKKQNKKIKKYIKTKKYIKQN